jgi:hypothetical protein
MSPQSLRRDGNWYHILPRLDILIELMNTQGWSLRSHPGKWIRLLIFDRSARRLSFRIGKTTANLRLCQYARQLLWMIQSIHWFSGWCWVELDHAFAASSSQSWKLIGIKADAVEYHALPRFMVSTTGILAGSRSRWIEKYCTEKLV